MHTSPFFNQAARVKLSQQELDLQNQNLYAAIAVRDMLGVEKALAAGAQPDDDHGSALRLSAQHDNYLAAKALMLAGADIGHAIIQAHRDNEAIPRRTDTGMIMTFRTPKTEEGKAREAALEKEIQKLETFQKTFIDSTLPIEQMNMLREIRMAQYDLTRRMDSMERALRDIDAPKPLDKKPARGGGTPARHLPKHGE